MAYQEGQYISQFLNTMPQQLATYAQQQEQTRQFDVQSKERQRQFDALQGLRESAEARTAEQYEYGKEQRSLLDLLIQQQRARSQDLFEAEARKTKAIEGRSLLEKISHYMGDVGVPLYDPDSGFEWAETKDEWARRVTGYDSGGIRETLQLPEGLDLNPVMDQYIKQNLPNYQESQYNLLDILKNQGRMSR